MSAGANLTTELSDGWPVDWRTVKGRYIKDPRLGHRLGRSYPGGEISDEYWNLRWLGTDRDGLIHNGSPERDYALGDRGFQRIFLLGGSTVMGLGVSRNQETIAAVMEQLLVKFGANIRVANCGVGAYMSWHELTYLALELIGYNPDIVVIVDGHNDFASSTWGNKGLHGAWIPNTHRSLDDIVKIVLRATVPRSELSPAGRNASVLQLLGDCLLKTRPGRYLAEQLAVLQGNKALISNSVWGEMDYSEWSVKESSVEWYLRNVRSMLGICSMNRVKVLHVLQPQLVAGNRKPTAAESDLLRRLNERMPPIIDLAPQWFALTHPRYQELCKERFEQVQLIDGSGWLDNEPEDVYHDWVHYNARGQQIIAEKLVGAITSSGWLR